MLDIRHLPLSTGKTLIASQWFRFVRAAFQYQHPGSFIRNHRQFRVNVSYCDFRVNLKPLADISISRVHIALVPAQLVVPEH